MNWWQFLYIVIGIIGFLAAIFLAEILVDIINQWRKGSRHHQEGSDD